MSAEIPADMHALKGTRATRAVVRESGFTKGKPKMPRDLSPVAAEEWKRIVKQLMARGTSTRLDASALEAYCRNFAMWRSCMAEAETKPMVDETDEHGIVRRVVNPAAKMATQLSHLLARYLASFSATPITREKTKPAAPPPPKKDSIIPGSVEDLQKQLAEINAQTPPETATEETPKYDDLPEIDI